MNRKLINGLLASLAMTISCFSFTSNAALIEADYTTGGDNLAAYDTVSGLTWLDFSVTKNLTYNQALSFSSDFRLATNAELASLYNSLVGNSQEKYNQFESVGLFNSANRAAGFVEGNGLAHVTNTAFNPAAYGYGVWSNTDFGGDSIAMFMVNTQSFQSPTPPNAVPEPSMLAIFALGLMGLASRRFKRQA